MPVCSPSEDKEEFVNNKCKSSDDGGGWNEEGEGKDGDGPGDEGADNFYSDNLDTEESSSASDNSAHAVVVEANYDCDEAERNDDAEDDGDDASNRVRIVINCAGSALWENMDWADLCARVS